MKFSLPAIAMRRPITVMMLLITVLGFGAIAARRTPVEFMPPMDLPFLGAFIPYPGATPAQVEQEIAIPAEGEFRTLPSLKQMYTNSSSDGCFISLNFDWGTPMSESLAEVRDRLERLRLVLPESADRVYVRHFSLESIPIMQVGLAREGDPDDFADLVDDEVVAKLLRLDGVADIEVFGYDPKSISIDLDQHALLNYKVSLYELIMRLTTANVDVGIGELLDGDTKYLVRAESEVETLEDYATLPLKQGIRLSDVATGRFESREADYHFSIDGEREIFLIITKESEANTVATCRAVMAELDRILETPAMEGTQKFVFFSQGDIINGALKGLRNAAQYGGIMALIVLFMFMKRLRPTLIVAMAIPGSLVGAFVVMFASGMSLNIVTMMSLIIAVGMVVDNSIVVIENIYRYQEMGYGAEESARRGASDVALAIVAATTTTAVVFLPVFYMNSGQMSVFMRQFAVPVTTALATSLLIALTVIPLMVSRFKQYDDSLMERFRRLLSHSEEEGRGRGGAGRVLGVWRMLSPGRWMMRGYLFTLELAVRQRLATVLVLAGFVAITINVPMKKMGFQQMPSTDRRTVDIDIYLDPNFDMAMAGEVFDLVESVVDERREELGVHHIFKSYGARGGELALYLLQEKDLGPGEKFPYTSEEVTNILWELLPERLPGATLRIAAGGGNQGGGGGQATVSLRMEGDDTKTLDRYAESLMAVFDELPGITDVYKSTQRVDQEIQLKIDSALADHAGIDPTTIAQTVGFALMGVPISEMKQGSREFRVWAQFKADDRKGIANLENVMMSGSSGRLVPLSQLVTMRKADTPQRIQRRNGKNYVYVTATTSASHLTDVRKSMFEIVKSFELPVGYKLSLGDELRNVQEDQRNFLSILIMAVILIFIVMSALFESCLMPLSILTSIPLAFLGMTWTMYLTGTPMDTVAFIGCILMVGVVVNNGIVIVDHISHLRREGLDRRAAIIQGGKDRVRPVLMTAITTILGVLPLALGGQFGNPAAVSIGRAMIGGLTAGTFLTLFVVPIVYSIVDDLQAWIMRYLSSVAGIRSRGRGRA